MSSIYSCLLLPQNYIAEEILIGIIIINPHLLQFIIKKIETDHFFIETNKIIYTNLITIHQNNCIDPVQLTYSLRETKTLQRVGGIKKITELIKQAQVFNFSNNISFYIKEIIKLVQSNYYRRLIVQYGFNIIQLAYNYEFSNSILIIKASQYLNYINSQINSENIDNLQELIGFLVTSIQKENDGDIFNNKKLYSGFKDLDILTNGLPQGDLIVIAGRPSTGKTSFVMNIVYHLLKYLRTQICLFSLEMTKTQILHKLISIGSGISIKDILSSKINKEQWSTIQRICNEILLAKIYINDNPNISIDEIKHITKIIIQNNLNNKIIIIDYLQLINENNFNIENRNQELSYITRKLKILAQTFKIPIIILSQLNRSIEKRLNKQPLLSDLKESGCVSYAIFTDGKKKNKIHIKTININTDNVTIKHLSVKSERCKIDRNLIEKIYVSNQHIFQCIVEYKKIILITHNHFCLYINRWFKENQLQQNHIITKLNESLYNTKYNEIEKVYIKEIAFWNYDMVYDIHKYEYCNFICNSIILHNSIEQDADIVMMLYKNSIQDKEMIESSLQILDIIISKNRNGPIGTFRLHFNPINTIFTSATHSINNIDNLAAIE